MSSTPLLIITAQPLLQQALTACFSKADRDPDAANATRQPVFTVIAHAQSTHEALEIMTDQHVAVILLDLDSAHDGATAAIESLLGRKPSVRILALASTGDAEFAVTVLRAGAHGFLTKTVDEVALFDATCRCLTENLVLEPELLHRLAAQAVGNHGAHISPETARKYGLDEREYKALAHLSQGISNQEIASAMYVSVGSVKAYLTGAARKLEASNRVQLLIRAYELGLISPRSR